ncbi:unnamed protein product [Didymodactylos carnosus]|uniref:Uncharacterized protein n=1 Tax=Didymodactylos carnosus TaxID=1234261 RepID=A0A816CK34_9BILA|nr:unnamed protein product [Didymodactylos carnosus]CAF1624433.1 unnamed protein product [Didymodactylos carnosus]CAF4151476.1 unnamed protein product [Didymodactylos carnosus]CAF4517305.1 unnamed protein product [Didymodactylos carnosus]
MTGTVVIQDGMDEPSEHLTKKLQTTDCVTSTIRKHACHAGICHNSTTYIHGCDTYQDDQCDNLTVHFDIYNSTSWRNTTCHLYACYEEVTENCGTAYLIFKSCSNGDCRNGVTHIHACYSSSYPMNQRTGASALSGLDVENGVDDIFDIPCVNLLFYTYRRTRFGSGK